MERVTFKMSDKFGKEMIFDVVATYHDDDTDKDFIVYTDNTFDKDYKLKLYYSLYKIIDNNIKLIEIKNIEDKKIGLQLIQELVKDINNRENT